MFVNFTKILSLYATVFILLFSAFLSFFALENAQRLHPDEAFYMTISRHAAINGDWLLLSESLDKPPFTYYTNALALVFFANETDENAVLQLDPIKGEFAGRMPATLMSILLVAVVMQVVKAVSDKPEAIYLAGILVALSPLRIVFAPTAFTDMPMLLFGTLALWMALRGQWGWSGVWFIVSISAKPQIIFYLPLLLALLTFYAYKYKNIRIIPISFLYFFIPVIFGVLLLWGWDAIRVTNGAESFYQLGQSRYTVTTLTSIADYPARFWEWWQTTQYLFGHAVLTSSIMIFAVFRMFFFKKISAYIALLWGWLFSFFAIHIVLTINLFDRNQIIILPIAVMIVALSFTRETRTNFRRKYRNVATFLLGILLLFFAIQASQWRLPIGGDDGQHDGIDELANYLNSKPVATVIYDRWLDWELDYYMGQWTDKRRVFYPTPELLVEGALSLDEDGIRYFIAPSDVNISEWLSALEMAQFSVDLDYESENFLVYSLNPPN